MRGMWIFGTACSFVVVVIELCPADMSPELQGELQKLRDCISVLFMFVRQPIQDDEFVQIVNGWIEQLASTEYYAALQTVTFLVIVAILVTKLVVKVAGFKLQASSCVHLTLYVLFCNNFRKRIQYILLLVGCFKGVHCCWF